MDVNYIQVILAVISGLAAAIPLVIKLVEYVQKAVKEKNWGQVVRLVMDLMATAETKFESGAEKKEWVLAMVQSSASTINYDVDMVAIGTLIDSLCDMSKVVNPPCPSEAGGRGRCLNISNT